MENGLVADVQIAILRLEKVVICVICPKLKVIKLLLRINSRNTESKKRPDNTKTLSNTSNNIKSKNIQILNTLFFIFIWGQLTFN